MPVRSVTGNALSNSGSFRNTLGRAPPPELTSLAMTQLTGRPPGPAPLTREVPDLLAEVTAAPGRPAEPPPDAAHAALLALCEGTALSVAELAAAGAQPVGVVRALVEDLRHLGYVVVRLPTPPPRRARTRALCEVIDGIRAL